MPQKTILENCFLSAALKGSQNSIYMLDKLGRMVQEALATLSTIAKLCQVDDLDKKQFDMSTELSQEKFIAVSQKHERGHTDCISTRAHYIK
jgi:hypothetical protein